MPRPRKPAYERYSKRLPHIRCTESQFELIRKNAELSGLSMSEYIRRMSLKGKIIIRHSPDHLELIVQLKKLANNLNQITRIANTYQKVPSSLAPLQLKLELILDELINQA